MRSSDYLTYPWFIPSFTAKNCSVLFPSLPQHNRPRRVVITGAGIVTAFGMGWRLNADGFAQGNRAFREVSLFDVSRQRVKVAAEVSLPNHLPETALGKRASARLERAAKMLLFAADEALAESNIARVTRSLPIVLGTTSGGMMLGEAFYRKAVQAGGSTRNQAERVSHYLAQAQAISLAEAFQLSGPVTIIANACAAGGNAIGHAWEMIRHGQSNQALAGGYDGLSQLVFAGFDSLQALSPTICRPFDQHRDGLALGEGAAVLILETLEQAEKRGAAILAEIVGYGSATDCHHLTQPHPEGEAAIRTMADACRMAEVMPEEIGYINAHGTGTALNDGAEAAAINTWAGAAAAQIQVSSTKASIGHLLGAAGAVEAVISTMVLKEGWIPPTRTTQTVDPAAKFKLVREPQTDAKINYVLSNSFGFGGSNASLLFRRWA
ncbi:MAG: beta-ketoacyl-[acyl-carrier-protein] synthase family protein [Verrucomicrobiales bacterium]